MTAARPLRLGTRASILALAQSGTVADALRALGVEVELVKVRTLGDQRPPDTTWGEGAFVGALETALLEGEVDLAVHSAKDVPTTEDPRLVIAAYPEREDPRDALVGREPGLTLATLPSGSRVGTDSPRRGAFLRAVRPDLQVHPLHGNVDTRLRRLDTGETDALILAVAGLTRLGRAERIGERLPTDVLPPAPGQGSLAIQCRADDETTLAWVSRLDDVATRAAVEAERTLLRASGGGCRAPLGGLARVEGDQIVILAGSAAIESAATTGATAAPIVTWAEAHGPVADRIAIAAGLAARLSADLAAKIAASTARAGAPSGPAGAGQPGSRRGRVLVTRTVAQAGPLTQALTDAGLDVVAIPTIDIQPVPAGGPLDQAAANLADYAWVVVTSPNGAASTVSATARAGIEPSASRWAAVGPTTAAKLGERGVTVAFTPSHHDGQALADELPIQPGDRVLMSRADLADDRAPARLRERGAVVDTVVAYRNAGPPAASQAALSTAFAAGPFDAIVFTSGSTTRGLMTLLNPQERRVALRALASCIGKETAKAAREAGFGRVSETADPSWATLAAFIAAQVAAPDAAHGSALTGSAGATPPPDPDHAATPAADREPR